MSNRRLLFLYSSEPLTDENIHEIEPYLCRDDSLLSQLGIRLLQDLRRVRHELVDPRYMYSGRVPRLAIIQRDEQIDKLRLEIKALKEEIEQLKEKK